MKKKILTSLICFTSLLFSSCGRRTIKVTILECSHCSFENKTIATVGQDFVIQAYLDKGYMLDTDSDLIEIFAGGVHLLEPCFKFNQTNNKLTIDKQYTSFGDITIKGNAGLKTSYVSYIIKSGTYYDISSETKDSIDIECGVYTKTIKKLSGGSQPTTKEEIKVYPTDIQFDYVLEDQQYTLKINQDYCYTDIVVTLP